jgi:4-coumarate--CoA ligase
VSTALNGFSATANQSRLIDDAGKDITAYDVRGELCVRGPSVIDEYFANPKANADSWDSDGFFKTGDIMYCDGKSKKWYIVDRKKICASILRYCYLTNL